jgi:hypothetical protein
MARNDLAPENRNAEQADAPEQAQTVARQARTRDTALGPDDSEKVKGRYDDDDEQDLVEHMNQMDTSGAIDMSAYDGEPNHDDNEDALGRRNKIDDLPSDGAP